MKHKLVSILALVLMMGFVSSCQEEGLSGDISRLKSDAKAAIEEVNEINIKLLEESKIEAHGLLEELLPYFNQFKEDALKTVVDLSNAEKVHKKTHFNTEALITDLNYSIDQLDGLYNESQLDSLSQEQIEAYLKKETEIIEGIKEQLSVYKNKMHKLETRYNDLLPKAKALIDSVH